MDTTALASSGLTGAVIAALYIFYKCCYRKKINSKCCCGEIKVEETPDLRPREAADTPTDLKV